MTNGKDNGNFGLSAQVIDRIIKLFPLFPEIERVVIYGSRALGRYENGSDIDLCFVGEKLTLKTILSIRCKLDDLNLPYKIDTALYHQIENYDLKDHIDRVGVILYQRND